jgi:molybdopterin-containing oxidoreductase family membrane subunit
MAEPGHEVGGDRAIIAPILETGRNFYITTGILLSIVAWAVFVWLLQLRHGLGMTGLNYPVMWGIYITNFVFFIGLSHAGTLISAILRLCKAEWRRAITRCAEVLTVLVLFIGMSNIILDLGREDRLLNVLKHPHLRSPLLWDVISVSTYLIASSIYLFLPLIPDIALMRDCTTKRRWFYRTLALGWSGTPGQWRVLERAITVMAVIVLPIAVSVHTVVSWVFGMTIQPMWHSTIFGPYFVAGAIFSGIAALIVTMAVLRWAYGLGEYFKEVHFRNLGALLLVMTLLWFYFTFSEFLTTYYGGEPVHMRVFDAKLWGPYAPLFWGMVLCCFIIPFGILAPNRTRNIPGTVIASIFVMIGMWLERYLIVVPTLINPRLPIARGVYYPTWVELSLTAGCFAAFILLYALFSKVFPIISVWEIREGRHQGIEEAMERIKGYLPAAETRAA